MALLDASAKGVSGGILAPNESRRRLNLPPVDGGDTPYLQQQNYSLAALDKRDSQDDPFASKSAPTAPASNATSEPPTSPSPPAAEASAKAWSAVDLQDFEDALRELVNA